MVLLLGLYRGLGICLKLFNGSSTRGCCIGGKCIDVHCFGLHSWWEKWAGDASEPLN